MYRTGGERSVDRQLARGNVTVTQDDLGTTGAHGFFSLIGNVADRGFQADAVVVVEVGDQGDRHAVDGVASGLTFAGCQMHRFREQARSHI